jgi:hypothetical protein
MTVAGEQCHFLSIFADHKPPHGMATAATDVIFAYAC